MKKHIVIWYEAKDGKTFNSELDCMEYELNLLYKESGVRLYDESNRLIEKLDVYHDSSYNLCKYITIDRTKENENRIFKEMLRYICGWILIEEAIDDNGAKYELDWNELTKIE